MTRYEKVVLALLLLSVALKAAAVAGADALFFFGLVVLGCSYLLGGYWLFNREAVATPIRIRAGVAFATAVLSFFYTSRVETDVFYKLLPAIDGVFLLGLLAYSRRKRAQAGHPLPAGLLGRALLLFVIPAFFAYCPISFGPYRNALLLLNHGRGDIVSNLRMFDYRAQYDAAMDRGDYAAAVTHGRQALAMGKRWLAADSVKRRRQISGAYTNVYTAYKSLGDAEYAQRRYRNAWFAYRAGHAFLATSDNRENGTDLPDEYWEEEKAWSLNNLAFCCLKLRQFHQGDSLFLGAIRAYRTLHPTPDANTARLVSDLARSFTAQREFAASTQVLQESNRYLATDTTRTAATLRVANALDMNVNYVQQDSLPQALRALHAIAYPRGDTTASRYKAGLQEAICYYKMERYRAVPPAVQMPLAYYRQHAGFGEAAALCQLLLAKNSLARARYAETQAYLNATRNTLHAERNGAASAVNRSCLSVWGALHKALGNYAEADQQFAQAIALLHANAPDDTGALAEVLAEMADLDVALDRETAAHEHAGQALALVQQGRSALLPSQTGYLATAAYVDYVQGHYTDARRKYRRVVAVNARYGQGPKATTAAAWNGLGLVETAQHRYERADSLFGQAVRLHETLFTEQHPLTATVYLNYGLLRLQQQRPADARFFLAKARRIAEALLPVGHDLFGDLAMAMGDVAAQEHQGAVAHGYYAQALAIYAPKLPASHWKVKAAKQKASA